MGTVPGRRMDMTFKQLYAWYIGSETWKAVRERALKRDKRKCRRCGAAEDLHVHHMTYERFTHENLSDLITVCETCHDYIHRTARENPRLTLEEATRCAVRELRGRQAMRQPQRRKGNGKVTVRLDPDEKCWCGQLVRVRHKHEPVTASAKRALPWENLGRNLKPGPDRPPTRPSKHDPDFVWVCTKEQGWQKERRALAGQPPPPRR